MDDTTHVIVARHFLKSCGCDPGASIYSLLPMVDGYPPYFHRLYAHCLVNFPDLLYEGLSRVPRLVSSGGRSPNAAPDSAPAPKVVNQYLFERIENDAGKMEGKLKEASSLMGDPSVLEISTDRLSALVALMTHIYLDTFNNPVQAFIPQNVYCSGQWDFWQEIDFDRFRNEFYRPEKLPGFWSRVAELKAVEAVEPGSMVKAIMKRMAELSTAKVEERLLDEFLVRLEEGITPRPSYGSMGAAMSFCLSFEDGLKETITSCMSPRAE